MIEAISQKLDPTQVAVLIVAFLYVTEKAAGFISHTIFKSKDKLDDNTQAVRELILKIEHLNNRLVAIELAIDKLEDFKLVTYKLEKDMGFAFEKIRDLRSERD